MRLINPVLEDGDVLLDGPPPDAVDHTQEEPSTLDEQLSYFGGLTVALEAQIPLNVPRKSKNYLAMQHRLAFFRDQIHAMRATMADRSQNHSVELAYFIQWFCTKLANFDHGFQKYYPKRTAKRTDDGGPTIPILPKYVCAIRDALAEGFMNHVYPLRAYFDAQEWHNEHSLDAAKRSMAEDHLDDPAYAYQPSILLNPTSIPDQIRRFGRPQDMNFTPPDPYAYWQRPVLTGIPRSVEATGVAAHGIEYPLFPDFGLTVRFTPPSADAIPGAQIAAAVAAARDAVITESPFVVVSTTGNQGAMVVSSSEDVVPAVAAEGEDGGFDEDTPTIVPNGPSDEIPVPYGVSGSAVKTTPSIPSVVPLEITASVPTLAARQGATRRRLWLAGLAAVVLGMVGIARGIRTPELESSPAPTAVIQKVPAPDFSFNPAFIPPLTPVFSVSPPVRLWTVAEQNLQDPAAATTATNAFLALRQSACDGVLSGLDARRKSDTHLFQRLQSFLTDTGYNSALGAVSSVHTIQELLDAQGPERDVVVQQVAARFLSPTQEVAWEIALQTQLAIDLVDVAQ